MGIPWEFNRGGPPAKGTPMPSFSAQGVELRAALVVAGCWLPELWQWARGARGLWQFGGSWGKWEGLLPRNVHYSSVPASGFRASGCPGVRYNKPGLSQEPGAGAGPGHTPRGN